MRGRTDLDVPRNLTPSLRHTFVEAKLDWVTIFDKERAIVVASDGGCSIGHDEGEKEKACF